MKEIGKGNQKTMKKKSVRSEASELMKSGKLADELASAIEKERGGLGFLLGMLKERPRTFNPFVLKGRSVYHKPAALDRKTAELVAVAAAAALHCEHCLDAHMDSALRQGATLGEIFDTLLISAAISESSALSVSCRKFKQFRERVEKTVKRKS